MSDKNYEVGYKNPPKSTQFKKGQSGNKSGRKKGSRNIKSDLIDELSETMTVTEKGKKVVTSKQRVFLKQVCNAAIQGDHKSAQLLAKIMQTYLGNQEEQNKAVAELSIDDEGILKRYAQTYLGET